MDAFELVCEDTVDDMTLTDNNISYRVVVKNRVQYEVRNRAYFIWTVIPTSITGCYISFYKLFKRFSPNILFN